MADLTAKKKQKLNRIRETNAAIVSEIEQMGGGLDLTVPRLEHFMVNLVELGILTEDQLLDEAYRWEMTLKDQLVPMVRDMRERIQEARRVAMERNKAAKRPRADGALILPPGVKRSEEAQPSGATED